MKNFYTIWYVNNQYYVRTTSGGQVNVNRPGLQYSITQRTWSTQICVNQNFLSSAIQVGSADCIIGDVCPEHVVSPERDNNNIISITAMSCFHAFMLGLQVIVSD